MMMIDSAPAKKPIKVLVEGRAQGTILKSQMPINFLGAVNKKTGVIMDQKHELYKKSIKDIILVFPSGAGSSVGAYTIYSIKSNSAAPRAMICQKADLTVATGCAVAGIPLVIVNDEHVLRTLHTGRCITLDTTQSDILSY